GATLTTADTPQRTSASAAIRSRSMWSMMATSPGRNRLVSRFVRRSRRAVPTTPGSRSPARERRNVAILILPECARRTSSSGPGARGGRRVQQFLRVTSRGDRLVQATEHPRQLRQPLLTVDPVHRGAGAGAPRLLAHDEVTV